jgi:hypothetical protein
MNIETMCAEATRVVSERINRSAGQHLRQMRDNAGAPTEADIFAMGMESDTAYKYGAWLCKQAGVSYPPVNKGEKA